MTKNIQKQTKSPIKGLNSGLSRGCDISLQKTVVNGLHWAPSSRQLNN